MKHCALICLLLLAATSATSAFGEGSLILNATKTGEGSVQLTLHVNGDDRLLPEIAGFDIYAHEWGGRGAGGACGTNTLTRVTPNMLWRLAGSYSFEVLDAGLPTDRAYFYDAIPVDANREPVPMALQAFSNLNSILWNGRVGACSARAAVSLGRALIAEIEVYGVPWSAYGESCEFSCYPWNGQVALPVELRHILNDENFYQLYGYVWVPPTWNGDDVLVVEEAVPTACVLAVSPSTWGKVKTLFRD